MPIEVILPKVDMDMEDGIITEWKVAAGDRVRQGQILFDIETNKSVMEVEAPGSGVIRDLAPITGEPGRRNAACSAPISICALKKKWGALRALSARRWATMRRTGLKATRRSATLAMARSGARAA